MLSGPASCGDPRKKLCCKLSDEYYRDLYPQAGHDHARHDGYSPVRSSRVPHTARERSAQRGLPHDSGGRQPSRRQPRDHGRFGGHSAGAPVLDHSGPGFHDLHQRARQHQRHPAIRAGPQPGWRRARRPGRHRYGPGPAACRHAQPADVSQGEPGGHAHPEPGSQLAHAAPLGGGRISARP